MSFVMSRWIVIFYDIVVRNISEILCFGILQQYFNYSIAYIFLFALVFESSFWLLLTQ